MYVHFALPDLAHLDALRCEALALPFFADERPLSGICGLVDWRLCGLISRGIAAGNIGGHVDETTMVATRQRLPVDRLLLFGLGARADFDAEALRARLDAMLQTVADSQARSVAMVLPGRNTGAIGAATAMEAFVAATEAGGAHDEVVLLEGHDAQREMEPVIERQRRRRRARDYA